MMPIFRLMESKLLRYVSFPFPRTQRTPCATLRYGVEENKNEDIRNKKADDRSSLSARFIINQHRPPMYRMKSGMELDM